MTKRRILAAVVLLVLVAVATAVWQLRPVETRETVREGGRLYVREHTRTWRLLPRAEWQLGRYFFESSGDVRRRDIRTLCLGFFVVIDDEARQWVTEEEPAPD
jgi:hypothetical protein